MILLGIDFEEWYHPELVKPYIKNEMKKPSIVKGIDKILDWLRITETYATFFVVGEILETNPEILDKIIENGHEIGFHTMNHTRLDSAGFREKFSGELERFANLTNNRSKGFRAPTFSLNYESKWAIDLLTEHGYTYDSSIMPTKTSMYGFSEAETRPYRISDTLIRDEPTGKILEFPMLIGKFLGKNVPTAGGFYIRFLPMTTIKKSIKEYA